MTSASGVWLVAQREVRARIRSKALRASTAFALLFVLGLAVLPGLGGDGDGIASYDVVVAGAGPDADRVRTALTEAGAPQRGVHLRVSAVSDEASAVDSVRRDGADAAVVDGRLLVRRGLEPALHGVLQRTLARTAAEAALEAAGVRDEAALAAVLDPPPAPVRVLEPESDDRATRRRLVQFGTFLLYGQLLGFGYWVAAGVIEEKSSRVIEVLLAKVRPTDVLTGKILGIGALGLAQLVAFVAVGLVAADLAGTLELPPETVLAAVEVLAWFTLGYALYSCLFAVSGALASRPEELQSTAMPLQVVAVGSFFAASFASGDPAGTVARIATFLPPSAPFVLPIRSAAGELPMTELVVSVGLVLASVAAAVVLAGRVYSGAAMHLRGQLGLRQALRLGER